MHHGARDLAAVRGAEEGDATCPTAFLREGFRRSPSKASPLNSASSANGGGASGSASRRARKIETLFACAFRSRSNRPIAERGTRRRTLGRGRERLEGVRDRPRRRACGDRGDLRRRAEGAFRAGTATRSQPDVASARSVPSAPVARNSRSAKTRWTPDGHVSTRFPRATEGAHGPSGGSARGSTSSPRRSASDPQPSAVALFPADSWKRSRSAGRRMVPPGPISLARTRVRLAEYEVAGAWARRGCCASARRFSYAARATATSSRNQPSSERRSACGPSTRAVGGLRVEVHEHHVRARGDALRRDVHEVRDPVRRLLAAPDGVRRVDADRKAREPLDDGDVREVDEVAVRVAEVRLDAARPKTICVFPSEARYSAALSDSFSVIPKPALHEDGKHRLAADRLQELEVLDVARADLEHDARRAAGLLEALGDLVDVALVRDLHRDDADAVLARLLEDPRKAALAVALEGVRVRARLVGAHARVSLPEGCERREHRLGVLRRVDGAEPGEDVQSVLRELDAVVREAARAPVVLVAADDAVLLRTRARRARRREGRRRPRARGGAYRR